MTQTTAREAVRPDPQVRGATVTRRRIRLPHRVDVAVAAGYLGIAILVMSRQWQRLDDAWLVESGHDQTMWEWFFAFTAHSIAHLESPLGTDLQNHPLGVNLMANTAMFAVSVPLAPLTLLAGATVTYVAVLTLGLFGTAFAWYWLFSRELVDSRIAAAVGGLFCGFAPAMVSHANGHPNFVALFLLPVIARQFTRLPASTKPRRDAVVLGVLVAVQIGLGEEPLLIFAMAFGLFAVVYHAHEPAEGLAAARAAFGPTCLAAAITLLITGPALWWQFFGSQSYSEIDHGSMGNDVKALIQFPSQSLGGMYSSGQNVAINPTEQNAYFGWPLLVLVAVIVVWLRRDRIVRAAGATVAVMGVLSLGAELTFGKVDTGISLPWAWFEHIPVLNSVLETRFAIACIPPIGILLALATAQAIRSRALRGWWIAALALALLPLAPTPLPVGDRAPTPDFFADGDWRQFTSDGSVVVVPLPRPVDARALRWQMQADFGFPIAGGYFVGPSGPERKGKYGPEERPTATLLTEAQSSGVVPWVTVDDRADALDDLRFWRADVVVLPPTPGQQTLKHTMDLLLGFSGVRVADAWVWDVRTLVHAGA